MPLLVKHLQQFFVRTPSLKEIVPINSSSIYIHILSSILNSNSYISFYETKIYFYNYVSYAWKWQGRSNDADKGSSAFSFILWSCFFIVSSFSSPREHVNRDRHIKGWKYWHIEDPRLKRPLSVKNDRIEGRGAVATLPGWGEGRADAVYRMQQNRL